MGWHRIALIRSTVFYLRFTFINSFIHSFIHYSSIHYSFIHSSIHSSVHPFINLFIHSSIYPCIHPSIHSFIPSSIHPFFYSFIHPFIKAPVHVMSDWQEQLSYNLHQSTIAIHLSCCVALVVAIWIKVILLPRWLSYQC